MKKALLLALSLVLCLLAATRGSAETEMKPIAVVSIAGYDALKTDVDTIGKLCGNPKLVEGFEATLKEMTQGKGLAGLDTKRPLGIACFPRPGDSPNLPKAITYGFLPVTDLKGLMEVAKGNPQFASSINLNGDVYEITRPGCPPTCVKQMGDWAVFTIVPSDLAGAPADLPNLLGDLPKQYDLAIRFLVKNLPETLRQDGIARLQSAADHIKLPVPGGTSQLKQAIPLLAKALDNVDEATLGVKIDSRSKKAHLDIKVVAKSGTKLADKFAAIKETKTAFAGVRLPDAAVLVTQTQSLVDDDVAQVKMSLDMSQKMLPGMLARNGLSEDQVSLISKFSEDVFDVLKETFEAKKIDLAVACLLEPESATVVGGATVANGEKLEKALQKLADELKKTDSEKAESFKIAAKTYNDLHIHYLSLPTPDQRLVPAVGDPMKVVLATSSDRVWFAIGRNTAKTMKKVIDDSKNAGSPEAPASETRVSLGKLAKFIGATIDCEMVKKPVERIVAALEKSGDKDHVAITTSAIESGMQLRIEFEEGAIQSLAAIK